MFKGFALYFAGLLVTMGSVGGIEASVSHVQLIQASLLALVGCAVMLLGVSYVKEHEA